MEGTGSYGAELARLPAPPPRIKTTEVNRPNGLARHARGKSDPITPNKPPEPSSPDKLPPSPKQ